MYRVGAGVPVSIEGQGSAGSTLGLCRLTQGRILQLYHVMACVTARASVINYLKPTDTRRRFYSIFSWQVRVARSRDSMNIEAVHGKPIFVGR